MNNPGAHPARRGYFWPHRLLGLRGRSRDGYGAVPATSPACLLGVLVVSKRAGDRDLWRAFEDAGVWGWLCPHRRHERRDSDDVHDAREIVGQHVQRHLGGDPWQRLHQEVRCAHPGLDRAEGMLNRLAPLAHLLRMLVEPALHRLENMLMLPSGDPSLLAGSAAVLDDAALAGVGRVATQDQAFVFGREGVGEPFAGRTDVHVLLSQITEVLLAEAPFRL